MIRFLAPFVLLAACGPDVSLSKQGLDADSDGYDASVDCDDAQVDVNPDAPEVCDGQDNDCDDVIDEDATDPATFYADGDGDGYGDPASPLEACEAPPGAVADGTDCDDAVAAVHPDADEPDCTDPTDYNCDGAVGYADSDGDGVPACEDCDDADPARSPYATEVCDDGDVDEDCDGRADDDDDASGASSWYADGDGDGWAADAGASVTRCDAPAGYVAATGDCDDSNRGANPGAAEVCDPADVDEDCDGAADDADASTDASTAASWYPDVDADGYGDGSGALARCDAPAGYVADARDCDDARAAVSPSATERCDDADVDEDCDGVADDDDSSVTGASTWYRDADGDTFGSATTTTACEAPSGYVPDATDCDDLDAAAFPGAAETCDDGVDQDCSGADDVCPSLGVYGPLATADADAVLYGTSSGAGFGWAMAAGDFDGDGAGDLAVSSYADATASAISGAVYGFTTVPTGGAYEASSVDTFLYYNTNSAYAGVFGIAVDNVGDLDEDGRDDVFVQVGYVDGFVFYGGDTGAAADTSADVTHTCSIADRGGDFDAATGADEWLCGYMYASGGAGTVEVYTGATAAPTATFTGESANDFAGQGVAGGGDVDGDGLADVWIGAPQRDVGGLNTGSVYLVYAPVSGTLPLAGADLTFRGGAVNDYLGSTVVSPGDIDGDGHDDVAIGKLGGDVAGVESGTLHLLTSPGSGIVTALGGVTVVGADADDYIGVTEPAFGDANGDGAIDLIVGSGRNDRGGSSTGAVWVVYGPLAGTLDLDSADAEILGTTPYGYLGYGVTFVPDVNGDGFDEVAVGSFSADVDGLPDRGGVWIFLGG